MNRLKKWMLAATKQQKIALADMAGTMERTVGMLSVLVADIRTCAVRVDQAGGEIAFALQHGQADQRLGAGQENTAGLSGVFVVDRCG